jgi:hypothetical protein
MLGLSSHDLSAMRELLGMPNKVLFEAQCGGGLYMAAGYRAVETIRSETVSDQEIAKFAMPPGSLVWVLVVR